MISQNLKLHDIIDYMKGFWESLFLHTNKFNYVIKNIELKFDGKKYSTLIYYQAIGTRTVLCDTATNLNEARTFVDFHPADAQCIVSIAAIESVLGCEKKEMEEKYINYARYYAKNIVSIRREKC